MSDLGEPKLPPCCEAWRECCGDDRCVLSGDSCHSGTCGRFRDEVSKHTVAPSPPPALAGKVVEVARLAAGYALRRLVIRLFSRWIG